jgi:hypothetical protein
MEKYLLATQNSYVNDLKCSLESGIDANTYVFGMPPLYALATYTMKESSLACAELLLCHDSRVNDTYDGATALYKAADNANMYGASFVELLVKHGADVNHVDSFGWTALHIACWSGNVDMEWKC